MMKPTKPPVNYRFSLSRTGDIEELLRRFYRAEVPQAWPAAPAVTPVRCEAKQPRKLAIGRFFRVPVRLAIAASVALLVIGYVTLQTWFPEPRSTSEVGNERMGSRDLTPHPINHLPPVPKQGSSTSKAQTQNPPDLPMTDLPAIKAKNK